MADALRSGRSGRKAVEVQVLLSAPKLTLSEMTAPRGGIPPTPPFRRALASAAKDFCGVILFLAPPSLRGKG